MAEPWLIRFFACNREMQPFSFFFLLFVVGRGGGDFGSGSGSKFNCAARVGSDDLGYGPGSGFSFEPVQTSRTQACTVFLGCSYVSSPVSCPLVPTEELRLMTSRRTSFLNRTLQVGPSSDIAFPPTSTHYMFAFLSWPFHWPPLLWYWTLISKMFTFGHCSACLLLIPPQRSWLLYL